jgi:FKBP-type peptidyl-prolyl cis-trans isomerase 2
VTETRCHCSLPFPAANAVLGVSGEADKLYIGSGHNRDSGLAMATEPEAVRSTRDPTRALLAVIAVAIVISVGLVGYIVYDNTKSHSVSSSDIVEMDDRVTMDYIGTFSDGRVFDTSLLDIAMNDALYPKSLTFTMRDNESYAPFEMVAGKYGEEGGTIKGFALGVIGLHVGDTEVIEVAPEDAYAVNPAMLRTVPIHEHVNGTEMIPEDSFTSLFKIQPTVMDYVPHYKWGWDVLVLEVEFGYVTYKHYPTVGEIVYPFGDPYADDPAGWSCVVESFDSTTNDGAGEIVVRHEVTASDVYAVKGVAFDDQPFVVSGYDAENETFEIHLSDPSIGYNGEISGRALFFEVTIISVTKV